MKLSDFDYDLPEELIAQHPPETRGGSRLLTVNGTDGALGHHMFGDLPDFLRPGDLVIFNNSKVIKARMYAVKAETGGKVEILVERVVNPKTVLAHCRASRSLKEGDEILIADHVKAVCTGRDDALFILKLEHDQDWLTLMDAHGHMPLPPYIARQDGADDETRYQNVYADEDRAGSVAAPTAGLHFTDQMLQNLTDKGIGIDYVTLHVGAGTFKPVQTEDFSQHKMHAELTHVSAALCDRITETKANGGRVIAVGTTSMRSLESAAASGTLKSMQGETDIFITPGFDFQVVDLLLTNFHLPKSTLLMLVSAFTGYEAMMNAYKTAVNEKYRFFSYGDAMLLSREGTSL